MLLFLPFVLLRNASDGIHVGTVTDSAGGRSNRNGWITERGYEEQERVRRRRRNPSVITKTLQKSRLSQEGLRLQRIIAVVGQL